MFHERNKGKIIIDVEIDNGKINSKLVRRGIAKKTEIALTTLLVNFVSLSIENDKDPVQLINKHLNETIKLFENAKKI